MESRRRSRTAIVAGILVGCQSVATLPSTAASAGAPSDALLEDLALHFSMTVYHLVSTCRIGSVVDPQLRVFGVRNLRVAAAGIMPNIVSGNTNAASIMIGEKAAEMIASDYDVRLKEFVVPKAASKTA